MPGNATRPGRFHILGQDLPPLFANNNTSHAHYMSDKMKSNLVKNQGNFRKMSEIGWRTGARRRAAAG
ncbi:hypothetical protein AX27061_4507 [Achromobacter xylosoxidans NBRC 15126 = ATCC 27061]|nr:hypothetical protein AX27061_4507 [Achromobacter xylosoxidans NBRC 15126 = ATCC 27061]